MGTAREFFDGLQATRSQVVYAKTFRISLIVLQNTKPILFLFLFQYGVIRFNLCKLFEKYQSVLWCMIFFRTDYLASRCFKTIRQAYKTVCGKICRSAVQKLIALCTKGVIIETTESSSAALKKIAKHTTAAAVGSLHGIRNTSCAFFKNVHDKICHRLCPFSLDRDQTESSSSGKGRGRAGTAKRARSRLKPPVITNRGDLKRAYCMHCITRLFEVCLS